MSIFSDSRYLAGQSFGHGLAPFDSVAVDSDEFVETSRLSLLVGEEGEVNISGPMKLFAPTDPIDSDKIPTFSKGNKFVAGLEKVLSGVPVGGVIAYARGRSIPSGYGRCDGSTYSIEGGGSFTAPKILPGFGGTGITWIVKLPAGAGERGAARRRANIGN
jgi:hypothetical protein